jgi:hypothetical protein
MLVTDCLNNQFMLYSYLKRLLNLGDASQYLKNNNIDINYYCIVTKVINNVHYIVTSNTTKKIGNGYRLIIVQEYEDSGENYVQYANDQIVVCYSNVKIVVGKEYDITNINKYIESYGIMIDNNSDNYKLSTGELNNITTYHKDINADDIDQIHINANKKQFFNELTLNCHFKNVNTIILSPHFNRIIAPHMLPKNLRELICGTSYNRPLAPNVLPPNLHTLKFGSCYNQEVLINVLPPNLQVLHFGKHYEHTIKPNVLPPNLQELELSYTYSKIIKDNVLPISICRIHFNYHNEREKNYVKDSLVSRSYLVLHVNTKR